MSRILVLLVLCATASCTPDTDHASPARPPAPAPQETPRDPDGSSLVFGRGRASCHDRRGDVRSEGSGDHDGPTQPAGDLSGVSVERYRAGMTFVFGTSGPVPQRVPLGARLQYSFTATDPRDPRALAVVSAILLHDDWMIEVREGDARRSLSQQPTIAGDVLELVLDAEEAPALMQGPFRWHALSEWAPSAPAGAPLEVFSDLCPNAGFPRFRGTST